MKTRIHIARRQRGAALVIGLILLMIITLLAVVGLNMSNSELASATSEQLRLRAFAAAETGIERGLKQLDLAGTASITSPVVLPAVDVVAAGTNAVDGTSLARYQNTLQYRGESGFVVGSSQRFKAFNYTVTSTGTSARNTVAVHTAGAFVVVGTL